jgi:hypothetical protein
MQPGQRVVFRVQIQGLLPTSIDLAGDALSWNTIEYPLTANNGDYIFGIIECFGTTNADIFFRAWKIA